MKKIYKNAKERSKHNSLKRLYGISIFDYNKMLKDQNGVCKICNKEEVLYNRTLAVDHCHTTGKIRGLLCMDCNKHLGGYESWYKKYENKVKEYLK